MGSGGDGEPGQEQPAVGARRGGTAGAAPGTAEGGWRRLRTGQHFKGCPDFDRERAGAAQPGPVLQSSPACASHFRNCMQKKAPQMGEGKKKGKKNVLGTETLLKVVFLSPIRPMAVMPENCSVCT